MQTPILIVDSHAPSRQALSALRRDCGYPVLEAHNGFDALASSRQHPPGMIIIDLWPFFSSTLRLVEGLCGGASPGRVPVLVVTSVVAPHYRRRAIAAGCEGYLEKPCAPDHVLSEVRRILSGPSARLLSAVADGGNPAVA